MANVNYDLLNGFGFLPWDLRACFILIKLYRLAKNLFIVFPAGPKCATKEGKVASDCFIVH